MPDTMPDIRAPDVDNRLDRFDRWQTRRFTAREAVISIAVAAVLLVAAAGTSIKRAGQQMNPGLGRDIVLAVGRPAAWISDELPVRSAAHTLTAWLSPDQSLGGGAFTAASPPTAEHAAVPAVTPDAFDPTDLGAAPPAPMKLTRLLVTGDSMSQPLDQDLARTLIPAGVNVTRDPHIGTGISKPILVDWGRLSRNQVDRFHPQAIVVFIGANEGFSMPGLGGHPVDCCGAEWAAIYATRVRTMMDTYRQDGAARVYWLTLPAPREPARQQIAKVVNAAIQVAAQPWRDEIRIIDTVPTFTPGGRYHDSITVNGTPTLVRQSDGIHLNDAGSTLAEQLVLTALKRDYRW
jgi:lysophospholipase L1-like esterase